MTEFEKELVRFVSGYLDAGVSAEDYVKAFSQRLLNSISRQSKEEPVCEGLEEEIERYLSTEWELDEDLNKDEPIYIYDCTWEDLKILARHFAKWQKEMMMKEAVETWMIEGSMYEPEFIKRKVIIIKEDK